MPTSEPSGCLRTPPRDKFADDSQVGQGGQAPSAAKQPQDWRTRPDPFKKSASGRARTHARASEGIHQGRSTNWPQLRTEKLPRLFHGYLLLLQFRTIVHETSRSSMGYYLARVSAYRVLPVGRSETHRRATTMVKAAAQGFEPTRAS
jgi:hypothetical protein